MSLKRIYAHWLDPELFSFRFPPITPFETRLDETEDLLKLHALFGYSICLSDVQLIDSLIILRLFSREDFRDFIWSDCFRGDADLTFLRLVSRSSDWDLGTQQLRVLMNGLARSLCPDWQSSSFETPEFTRAVATAFKAHRIQDQLHAQQLFEHGDLRVLRDHQPNPAARGLINALEYFVQFPNNVELTPAPATTSYSEILEEAETVAEPNSVLHGQLQATLGYLKKLPNRFQRTPAVIGLVNDGMKDPENVISYLHIIQAWNFGVSRSVAANLDSGTGFGVPSIGTLFGQSDNWTVPLSVLDPCDLFEQWFATSWHPSHTPWTAIAALRDRNSARIRRFQSSIGTAGNWDAFRDLVTAIAEQEASRTPSRLNAPRRVLLLSEVVRAGGPSGLARSFPVALA